MSVISETINNSRKIVLKIGSHVLSNDNGHINKGFLQSVANQINELMKAGKQVIIVSSGAGICGATAINKWNRRGDINYKQALCAIGQVELMNAYKESFADYDIHVGQILLTGDDFADEKRILHIRNTLFTLVDEGVIPVINENDSVSVDEIKIGDNDTIGAYTASLWNADLLIILSDIEGVYDKNPKENKDAKLICEVYDIDELVRDIDMSGTSNFGTGGIETKIGAARNVVEYGIPMMLLNGKKKDALKNAIEGTSVGTIFFGK